VGERGSLAPTGKHRGGDGFDELFHGQRYSDKD